MGVVRDSNQSELRAGREARFSLRGEPRVARFEVHHARRRATPTRETLILGGDLNDPGRHLACYESVTPTSHTFV